MSTDVPEAFPWQRMMAIGFGVLHLAPAEFWSMTMPELEAAVSGLTGGEENNQPLARNELDELMQRFPD